MHHGTNANKGLEEGVLVSDELVKHPRGQMRMQALRSASPWSLGRKSTESSIYECYLEAIANSDRYVYIENQFIISSTTPDVPVENKIIKALFLRILKAHEAREPFKVIIFLPLLPAFEASLEDQQGKVMQIQIALENKTIGAGDTSLIQKLREALRNSNMNPEDYVLVCGLRTWEFRPSDMKPITEIIYIHSKLMIIDDNYLVMGSANLNDRSMLGSRDSELAVFVEGPGNKQVFTGYDNILVNDKIHEFRVRLFEEHFGFKIEYPTAPNSWQQMSLTASNNARIYSEVFKVYPDNQYKTFESLARRNKDFDERKFQTEIGQIKGHAVKYPYEFLSEEKILESKNSELSMLAVPLFALT